MQNFSRIGENLDIGPVLDELASASDAWGADTSRQRNVRCQRHTRNIFLRAPVKPLPPGETNSNNVHESRLTRQAQYFPQTLSLCQGVAEHRGGDLGRAMLVALLPKRKVTPHVDLGAYYRIRDRFHLVLTSIRGSPITVGSETVVMRSGELWAFDNKKRHWALNPSGEPRVHLIFDVLPPPGQGLYVYPMPGPQEDSDGTAANG